VSIAHRYELILVTFNTADYMRFQEIRLDDWRS
jgi:predicted nucleic acid-binding protein